MTKENYRSYGNQEVIECLMYFNKFLNSLENFEQKDEWIDLDYIKSEWRTLKTEIRTNYLGADVKALNLLMTRSGEYWSLGKSDNFAEVIPITSMECEWTFSKMNLIKTSLRNCLENDTLDDLMISM